jgi:hypothetical protein
MTSSAHIWSSWDTSEESLKVRPPDGNEHFLSSLDREAGIGPNDLPLLPWEANEASLPLEITNVLSPLGRGTPIVASPSASERARRYVEGIQARLPERMREAITSSAGAFDFPVDEQDNLDDLFER